LRPACKWVCCVWPGQLGDAEGMPVAGRNQIIYSLYMCIYIYMPAEGRPCCVGLSRVEALSSNMCTRWQTWSQVLRPPFSMLVRLLSAAMLGYKQPPPTRFQHRFRPWFWHYLDIISSTVSCSSEIRFRKTNHTNGSWISSIFDYFCVMRYIYHYHMRWTIVRSYIQLYIWG
jgi:hypothetical protein